MANFVGCAECGHVSMMVGAAAEEKKETDTSTEIRYHHVCLQCAHVIAEHSYCFRCTDEQHVYRMECDLCGEGELEQDIEVQGLE